ncbi:MAG: hypothetical protein U5M23_15920 [Marinagarivorans sp.]|nr:hypothetical protein [Marinagarivorans sp.]
MPISHPGPGARRATPTPKIAALRSKDVEFYAEIRAAIKKHSGEELDIKPFEADMRHLINTYVQADPANLLGDLSPLALPTGKPIPATTGATTPLFVCKRLSTTAACPR